MKILKSILTAIAITFVVLTAVTASNHFIGEVYTNAILLILVCVSIAFYFLLCLGEENITTNIVHAEKVDSEGVFEFLEEIGKEVKDLSYMSNLRPFDIQPAVAALSQEGRSMRYDEQNLRGRLTKAIRYRDSETFGSLDEHSKIAMYIQIGAMVFYHNALISRCIFAGFLLENDSSGSSSSDSSDNSSSSSSSDCSSSLDSSGSSDSSDSSSSSDSSGSGSGDGSSSSCSSSSSSSDGSSSSDSSDSSGSGSSDGSSDGSSSLDSSESSDSSGDSSSSDSSDSSSSDGSSSSDNSSSSSSSDSSDSSRSSSDSSDGSGIHYVNKDKKRRYSKSKKSSKR